MSDNNAIYQKYNKLIDELYEFRDKYYILNPTSNSDDRNNDLTKKLNENVADLDSIKDSFNSKSDYLVLLGRAHNVMPDYSQKAFDALSKAVKLDPKCYDAWNYLGECYWKKREFESSRNCFERSVNIEKNKLSLRGLSMVTRHLAGVQQNTHDNSDTLTTNNGKSDGTKATVEDPKFFITESLRYAKEALQLDLKDGMSWYILANSYLAQFFSPLGQQNPGLLKQAISAYNLALKDPSACLQSDLYFNKSMSSLYEENWRDVLVCLNKALELDPSWSEVRDNLKEVLSYLVQIEGSVSNHGRLKPKRFQGLVNAISDVDAGPYLDKNLDLSKTKKKFDLQKASLKDLKVGLNAGKVLIGKVISGQPTKTTENFSMVCFICCIADANGDCAALSIYNLINGEGVIIGDSIAIPEPWLEMVDFKHSQPQSLLSNSQDNSVTDYTFAFKSIRVENPSILVVNGKKWSRDKVSSAVFIPKVLDD